MLAAGNLPGGLTQEAVQTALTGVTAALEAQDVEAARKILGDLFQSMADNQQQSLIDRVTSGIKAQVEKLQSMLAAGNLPGGLTQEVVQTALTGVTAALEAQDVEAARKILSDLFQSMAENQQQSLIDRVTSGIKAQVEKLQSMLAAGNLPGGLTQEAVQTALTGVTAALEAQDVEAARKILSDLFRSMAENQQEQTLLERMTAAIKAQLEGIQKAADAGKLPAGVTSEAVSAAIEEATKALESKDIQGARQILANLLKPAVDNDKPAPPAPPVVSLPVAPTPLPIPVPLPNLPVNLPAQVTNVGARIANVAKSFFGR
jgi:hypothetical protein